jgi:hypothetical protein
MYAMSNRCWPAPTLALALILSTRPGKAGGTETTIAAAARQFCELYSDVKCIRVTGTYDSMGVPIPAMRPIHRRNVDPGAVHKPVLFGIRFEPY